MALKLVRMMSRRAPAVASRQMSGGPVWYTDDKTIGGTREVVGYGVNGTNAYFDRDECPMPAIRYREEDSSIKAIREKEKGDWKKLTIEEKKALYRFSFCQTFSEFQAPSGDWKFVIGWSLFGLSLSYFMGHWFGLLMPRDPSFDVYYERETRIASEQRRLDMGIGNTRQYGAEWDVEKRDWKK